MKITINDHRKISALQADFRQLFPFLKLEFFSKPHRSGGAASKTLIGHDKTLGECRTIHNKGTLTITPQMTASDLRQHFSDVYGLSVEILHMVGNSWIEIGYSEKRTLAEQNTRSAHDEN
jgi:hypothetical protein